MLFKSNVEAIKVTACWRFETGLLVPYKTELFYLNSSWNCSSSSDEAVQHELVYNKNLILVEPCEAHKQLNISNGRTAYPQKDRLKRKEHHWTCQVQKVYGDEEHFTKDNKALSSLLLLLRKSEVSTKIPQMQISVSCESEAIEVAHL